MLDSGLRFLHVLIANSLCLESVVDLIFVTFTVFSLLGKLPNVFRLSFLFLFMWHTEIMKYL